MSNLPSTALRTEPAHPAVAGLSAGNVMAIVPQTFDEVFRFAQILAKSGLCPYGMDTPEKVAVAILTGLEIGVKPMQAVQGIAVIGGRPCVWGDLGLGVVRASGLVEHIIETYEGEESKVDWTTLKPEGAMLEFQAVCRVKRKGEPEHIVTFSIRDAVVAKLWGKKGHSGKDTPWITNPKRMLRMRARGFGLRDQFADVLKGMPLAEELVGTELDNAFDPAPQGPPVIERGHPPAPPPPPAHMVERRPDAEIVEDVKRIAERIVPSNPEPAPRVITPEDQENMLHDFLTEMDDRLESARTEIEVEEIYTDQDAEAQAAEFPGGVEHVRSLKRHHLDRIAKRAKPLPELSAAVADMPAAETEMLREAGALPPQDDDFPGNAAIIEKYKAAGGRVAEPKPKPEPEVDPVENYKQRLFAVLNDPDATEASIQHFWDSTQEERNTCGADQARRLRWKSRKQQAIADIRDAAP